MDRTERYQEADIESDWETYIELSDLEADLEVGESLPAPPTDRQFATIDEAIATINKFTGENGYAVPKSIKKGISTRSTFNATVGGHFDHR